MKKQLRSISLLTIFITFLVLWTCVATIQPALACSSDPDDDGDCAKCIANRMKYNCPACAKMLKCMAKCLWSGVGKAKCMKKCDCSTSKDDYPTLSDCKKCMSNCRCACIS